MSMTLQDLATVVVFLFMGAVAIGIAFIVGSAVLSKFREKKTQNRSQCLHGIRAGEFGKCGPCTEEKAARSLAALIAGPCSHGILGGEVGACPPCTKTRSIHDAANSLREQEKFSLRQKMLSQAASYYELGSQQFEGAIAELFRQLGYEVTQTPYSNDGGKDAMAWKDGRKFLIECKRYAAAQAVGRRDLQILVAAMKDEDAAAGFYVNTGCFTAPAVSYARSHSITLVDRVALAKLVCEVHPKTDVVLDIPVMCRECGTVSSLAVQGTPTTGYCGNGHQIRNDVTYNVLMGRSLVRPSIQRKIRKRF